MTCTSPVRSRPKKCTVPSSSSAPSDEDVRGGRRAARASAAPSRAVMEVEVHEFRSFCLRGEGRANIVISAKHRVTGNRLVWRFAKTRKSGQLSTKTKSSVAGEYMQTMVAPLLSERFLVSPRTVEMRVEHVHHLAKIAALSTNVKVESVEELEALPAEMSLLPLHSIPPGVQRVVCLEMLDATCIPKRLSALSDLPTVTMEIKPKQGYLQTHPGVTVPYCNNCILQMEKCGGQKALFHRMYDFCPLQLFSSQEEEQRAAIDALLEEPHRNLRLFLDGNTVLSDEIIPSREELQKMIYKNNEASLDDLRDGVVAVLNERVPSPDGQLLPSLLSQLLAAQRIDILGVVRAHQLFFSLTPQQQAEVGRKVQSKEGLSFLKEENAVALLKRYFLAATLKDCSVMISLRLLQNEMEERDLVGPRDVITLPSGCKFAYSAKIVDLDPKSAKNLISAHKRLLAGAELIVQRGCSRKECAGYEEKNGGRRVSSAPPYL